KVNYMRYTVSEITRGNNMTQYSDGQRLTSIQKSWDIFKDNALVGVGAGDLPRATEQAFNDDTIQAVRMPHNQWVWLLASVGLMGTLIVAFSLFFPVFQMRHELNALTVSFFAVIHTSLLTEATLEEQIGSAFYLVFLMLFISVYASNQTSAKRDEQRMRPTNPLYQPSA
ncbi:MAG TPA: O-antigen ligase family protein, partial [Chitinophagales bacterium]|nr:O-antigen ligase family protein [Chitinophagales bacterium]